MEGIKPAAGKTGNLLQSNLEIALQPISDSKCQEENQRHNSQKDGKSQPTMCKQPVYPVCSFLLCRLIYQNLFDDLFDKIIFLVDDIFLITAVNHII